MTFKRLFMLVEGPDDNRFFSTVVKKKLEKRYDEVRLWEYADKKHQRIDNFLASITAMAADYIYVTDINLHPCVTAKKQSVQQKVKRLDLSKTLVVVREIECWYLAGLADLRLKKLGLTKINDTEGLTKQQFDQLMPNRFVSRIDFMVELLKSFSIDTAMKRNRSFRYFAQKYILTS